VTVQSDGGDAMAGAKGFIPRRTTMLRMRDIMTRRVVTLEPQMTLREAMEILVARHLSGAPVVSGERVVGVISAGDLLSFAAAPSRDDERQVESTIVDEWDEPAEWEDDEASESASFFTDMWDDHTEDANDVINSQGDTSPDNLSNHLVEEAMTKTIRWLSPDADVTSAADMMRHYGVHRILVVDHGRLVGLVSAMDIAKAVADRKLTNRTYVFDKPASRPDSD
jgi:CBS domain-containing protein